MGSPFPICEYIDRWDPDLEPNPNEGWRSQNMEPLNDYLNRVRAHVGHLPDQVVEQCVDLHVKLNQIHGVLHSKVTLLLTVSLSSFQCVDWFSMV